MHPTTSLGRWDALNSMSTCLVTELLDMFSLNHKADVVEPAKRRCLNRPVTLSALQGSTALVGLRKLSYEKLSIIAALGSTSFNGNRRHL